MVMAMVQVRLMRMLVGHRNVPVRMRVPSAWLDMTMIVIVVIVVMPMRV